MNNSDLELIDSILKGNKYALDILVRKHYKTIYCYVYRNIGDESLSYDLTQEIFIKVIKNIKSFNSDKEFKYWMLKVALNHCRDYFKSKSFKEFSHLELKEEIKEDNNIIDFLEKKENTKRIKDALMKLPEVQREAIIFKYYNDMKISEVAEVLDISHNTVKSRIYQGIKRLKGILIGGDDGDKKRDDKRRVF